MKTLKIVFVLTALFVVPCSWGEEDAAKLIRQFDERPDLEILKSAHAAAQNIKWETNSPGWETLRDQRFEVCTKILKRVVAKRDAKLPKELHAFSAEWAAAKKSGDADKLKGLEPRGKEMEERFKTDRAWDHLERDVMFDMTFDLRYHFYDLKTKAAAKAVLQRELGDEVLVKKIVDQATPLMPPLKPPGQ